MRTFHYHPRAIRRLVAMGATDEEWDIINSQVAELAKNPLRGYQVLFQTWSKKLYRFDVGRFGLIYTFSKTEVYVITVA